MTYEPPYQPQQVGYPAQPAAAPVYQAQPAPTAQPTTLAYTNTFALLAVIFGFVVPILGIVFGHMSLGQIKRNGDAGRGLALTGLIVGYAYAVFIAFVIVAYIGMILVMIASIGAAVGSVDSFAS